MTVLAVLAASLARMQAVRSDVVAEFAMGQALDDLNQTGLEIAVSTLSTTWCQPENISGAIQDGSGRSTINRKVNTVGDLIISFCNNTDPCFADDWQGIGKYAEWAILIKGTIKQRQKSLQVGLNSNGVCSLPPGTGGIQQIPFAITYWG